jgi:hypothetical protein
VHSLVFYPKPGAIGVFNLKTRRSQEAVLPVGPEALLDQFEDGTGHLVAYVAAGHCEPDASSEEATSRGLAKLEPGYAGPQQVCFAKLP